MIPNVPRSENPEPPWARMPVGARHLLLAAVVALAALLAIGRLLGLQPEPSAGTVVVFLLVQSAVLLFAVWLAAVRLAGARWSQLGLRPTTRAWVRRAFGIGLLSLPALWAINAVVQGLVPGTFRNPQIDLIAPQGPDVGALLGQLAAMAVVVPFVEELLFRGLLYGWLRRYLGTAAAALLGALAFSLLHGIALLVPAILLQGVVLALVYERSGSLVPCMIVHGTINAVNVALVHAVLASGVPLAG